MNSLTLPSNASANLNLNLNELYEVCEVLNLDALRFGQFFQNQMQW